MMSRTLTLSRLLDGDSTLSTVGVPTLAAIIGGAIGLAAALALGAAVRRALGRTPDVQTVAARGRLPLRLTLTLIGVHIGLRYSTAASDWRTVADHAFTLGIIAGLTWLMAVVAQAVAELALSRFRMDVGDNRTARRLRTQVTLLRRIVVALIVVLGLGAALLTFPGARIAGAGVLGSAGLISIVAGLAAQSSLANIFAGLQLAFTDAIRVDDVVVVKEYWGRIDEITLTYVVVRVWDERSIILPSTYFTTTPFENWTRKNSLMLGTVELDLDWSVPMEAVRDRVQQALDATDRWDGRVNSVQVTDATGSHVRVRVLISAADSPTLWDLRCEVREGLVSWLQEQHPQALPRVRTEVAATPDRDQHAGAVVESESL